MAWLAQMRRTSAAPYAYVSDRELPRDEYWNAPFGAYRTAAEVDDLADLVGFWSTGLQRLGG